MGYPSTGRPRHSRADLIVLLLLLLAGVALGRLPPDRTLAVTRGLRATVLAPALALHGQFSRYSRLSERFTRLRTERDSLVRELVRARSAAFEADDLRRTLEIEGMGLGEYVPAEIMVGRTRSGLSRTFLLDVGDGEGLSAPTGVFGVDGLVGVVRTAVSGRAQGDFWIHPDFRVSVRTASGEATGIVRPVLESGHHLMLMEGAPFQSEVPAGTPLYTSGLGGIYPQGIPVGTVRQVSRVESGWERSYLVEPAVHPEGVGAVLVWRRSEEAR